jgi:hypothetical protein
MGTEGIKYSLVSREVINAVVSCRGQWMDGVRWWSAAVTKKHARRPDGHAARQRARDLCLRRHDPARQRLKGKTDIVSVFRKLSVENAAGRMVRIYCRLSAARAIPSTNGCGGMYTAQRCPAFEGFGHFAATQRHNSQPATR